uniref:Uncharacterized protein n=1 Tax=Arundo donax TaxID=35708 RepID=A0A0A9DW03_ARUDO
MGLQLGMTGILCIHSTPELLLLGQIAILQLHVPPDARPQLLYVLTHLVNSPLEIGLALALHLLGKEPLHILPPAELDDGPGLGPAAAAVCLRGRRPSIRRAVVDSQQHAPRRCHLEPHPPPRCPQVLLLHVGAARR